MNRQEFEKFWNGCIIPTFEELSRVDPLLYIREGSLDSVCRRYNDIKNNAKRLFMKHANDAVKLDRHKIAACMAKAIVLDRPVCKKIETGYTGSEEEFVIANEVLAFAAAMSILRAYIRLRLEKQEECGMPQEQAYRKICESEFVFPETIMQVDYKTSVCWAWHHNAIEGHFDILGTANLLFMIEQYSVEKYS